MGSDGRLIELDRLFALQDGIARKHTEWDRETTTFIRLAIELCLNRNWNCAPSSTCISVNLAVFQLLFQEVVASLINAYRVALWGSYTDAYAILRVVIEGLQFIDYTSDENLFSLLAAPRSRQTSKRSSLIGRITNRAKADRKLNHDAMKVIDDLSSVASHFSDSRLAHRAYILDGVVTSGLPFALFEGENEFGRKVGALINTSLYAVRVMNSFFVKYHHGCMPASFWQDCTELEHRYERLVLLLRGRDDSPSEPIIEE